MDKRYFRLKRETPGLKKGALFVTSSTPDRYDYISGSKYDFDNVVYMAQVIENEPEWFDEVFQTYLTREEMLKVNGHTFTTSPKATKKTVWLSDATQKRIAAQRTPEYRAAQSKRVKAYWRKRKAAEKRAA